MNILIIDDDPIVVHSCCRILEAEGIKVMTAADVASGIQMLRQGRFDLVITDIKMPGRDGFDLIRTVKAVTPELPVLMMTGYLTGETVARGRQAGADQCIAKPFTPEELVAAVNAQVRH
ncbi:MAG: response regulator [Desulfobacter sp.]|nr:MAG: response regulator [Desulfobacter sp.]